LFLVLLVTLVVRLILGCAYVAGGKGNDRVAYERGIHPDGEHPGFFFSGGLVCAFIGRIKEGSK
jgi:hypothetical protein